MYRFATAIAGTFLILSFGCNTGSSDLAKTKGKVTYNGEPVTEGTLTYYPSAEGRPGSAKLNSDGTFVMTTFEEGDGLWKGPGRLEYSAPEIEPPENLRPGQSLPQHENHGLAPSPAEVTIEEGENNLEIELTRK